MNIKNWFRKFGWLTLDLGVGAAWTLAFPPFNLLPCFWLGGFYLLWRVFGAQTIKTAAWRGWLWGLGVVWGTYYWIAPSLKAFGGIPAWANIPLTQLYASVFAVEYLLAGGLLWLVFKHFKSAWARLGLITLVLTALDVMFPQIFPAEAAIGLVNQPFWLQTMDIWGSPGISAGLYLSLAWVWLAFRRQPPVAIETLDSAGSKPSGYRPPAWLLAAPLALVVMFMAAYGIYSQSRWANNREGKPVRLASVQASISNEDKDAAFRLNDAAAQARITQTYLDMSEQAIYVGAGLVVWPETALPVYANLHTEAQSRLSNMSMSLRTDFLFGAFTEVKQGEDKTARHNGLFYMDSEEGEVTQYYHKTTLLFGSEYTPFYNQLGWLRRIYPRAPNLTAGTGPKIIDWDGTSLGTSICYEGIQPYFMQKTGKPAATNTT